MNVRSVRHALMSLTLLAAVAGCAGMSNQPPAPISQAPEVTPQAPGSIAAGKVEVLWLGQAAVRITSPGGKVIMIDPWLTTNPKTPASFKQLESVGKVDLILVTHAHNDHLGDTVALAKLNGAPVLNGGGLGNTLVTLGMLPAQQSVRFGRSGTVAPLGANGPKVTAVHAQHSSELVWKNPASGKDETHYGGDAVGYIVELENGFKIWHMGDTGLFYDMRLISETYQPDLVLIPIGGHFTMGPREAAVAVRELVRPRYVMPIHYGTFPVLRGTPQEFITALGPTGTRVVVPEPGQKADF